MMRGKINSGHLDIFAVFLCLGVTAFCLVMIGASLSKTLQNQLQAGQWKAMLSEKEKGIEAAYVDDEFHGADNESRSQASPLGATHAYVTRPRPNARYLKTGDGPARITFIWNRPGIDPEDLLKLEIAEDRNFSRVARFIPAYDVADANLDAGLWFWRLSYGDELLDTGRLTITDAPGPALFNPVMNHIYRYRAEDAQGPELLYRWSEIAGASHYILEAARTPDFEIPVMSERIWGTFFVSSNLGPGTWYWRVHPVFHPAYEGVPGVSGVGSFCVEF